MTNQYQTRASPTFSIGNLEFLRRTVVLAAAFISILSGAYTKSVFAQSIFRAGECQQTNGPLTCDVAKNGGFYYVEGTPTGPQKRYGSNVSTMFSGILTRETARSAATTPVGQYPLVWEIDPTKLACNDGSIAYWDGSRFRGNAVQAEFVGTCYLIQKQNGFIVASGSINMYREAICPQGWDFYGSVAPNYNQPPGYCAFSFPNSIKNLTGQDCTGCNSSLFGNPIEASIFNKSQRETDYRAIGTAMPIVIERLYNSAGSTARVQIGVGWRLSYDKHLVLDSSGFVSAHRETGGVFGFRVVNGSYVVSGDVNLSLLALRDSANVLQGWTLRTANDEIETYDANGRLISIKNRNGATTQLA